MKKSIVFIISIFMLSLLPPFGAQGAASFVNGGFESAENGVPQGWSAEGGTFGTALSITETDPAEGNYSLCITASGQTSAVQTVPVSKDKLYLFSGYYKIEQLSAGGSITFQAECDNDAYSSGETIAKAENVWKSFSFSFTTDSTVSSCIISLSVTGGTAYFDGIVFSESGIIKNGSFAETTAQGYPVSWNASDGWGTTDKAGDAVYEKSITDGYDGSAVLISNLTEDANGNAPEKRNPYVSQGVVCESSSTYILSGFFKAKSDASVVIKVEDYAGKSNFSSKNHTLQGDGSWKSFSIGITTTEDETSFIILLRLLGKGEVAFDEISLTFTGKTEGGQMRVEPKDFFAYSDQTIGTATVTIPGNIARGSRVVLSLFDGSSVLFSLEKDAQSTTVFSYDNTKMTEFGKGYRLLAQHTTARGDVLTETEETIYRYARPTHLRADGTFVDHDGKAVSPVIAYHVPVTDYEKVAEIGVNVVQCIYTSAYPDSIAAALDKAEKLGLYLMIPLYANMKPAGSPENHDLTLACIERFKDHKALYAWMVMDEPQPLYDDMYEALKASYKLIRDADPAHPIYICECNPLSYALSGRCCDILCIDPYPNFLTNIDRVYTDTLLAIEATNGEKPVYNLLQAWQWNSDWEPSAQELRKMIYLAVMGGAKGFGYYPVHDNSSTMYSLPLWDGAVSFSDFEKDAIFSAFMQGEKPYIENTSSYLYAEAGAYIFAVNRTGGAVSFKVPSLQTGNPVVINGEAEVKKEADGILLQLAAHGAICIKMQNEPGFVVQKNGLSVSTLDVGTYTIQTTSSTSFGVYTAVYEEQGHGMHLLDIHVGTDTFMITCMPGKRYVVKGFFWDGITPKSEVFTIS